MKRSLLIVFTLLILVAGCVPISRPAEQPVRSTTTETAISAVFDAFNAATNDNDVEAELSFFADNAAAQFINRPIPDLPNLYTGKTEIRQWLEADAGVNQHVEIADTKVSGNIVTASVRTTVDVLPFTLVGRVKVTIKDGKIVSFIYTMDDETANKIKELLGSQ